MHLTRSLAAVAAALAAGLAGCSRDAVTVVDASPAEAPTASTQERAMDLDVADLYPQLAGFVRDRSGEFDQIEPDRKTALEGLADEVARRAVDGEPVRMTFICTHNSRRSHMSQLWAQTAAHVYGVPGVVTFSGGTEATAFNPRAVAAVRRAGFEVVDGGGDNPVYTVRFADQGPMMECFSKVYDQAPNPSEGFVAVMTCSAADAACPIVFGAEARISIPYEDPKAFDDTEREAAMYDERCRQIAREMLYVFSLVELS
jgi:arsenate reductase